MLVGLYNAKTDNLFHVSAMSFPWRTDDRAGQLTGLCEAQNLSAWLPKHTPGPQLAPTPLTSQGTLCVTPSFGA